MGVGKTPSKDKSKTPGKGLGTSAEKGAYYSP